MLGKVTAQGRSVSRPTISLLKKFPRRTKAIGMVAATANKSRKVKNLSFLWRRRKIK